MLLIPCPWCGSRDEIEFAPRGVVVARPEPNLADDKTWTGYLFYGDNARGWLREHWAHVHGCGQVFVVRRHTVTNAIAADDTAEPAA